MRGRALPPVRRRLLRRQRGLRMGEHAPRRSAGHGLTPLFQRMTFAAAPVALPSGFFSAHTSPCEGSVRPGRGRRPPICTRACPFLRSVHPASCAGDSISATSPPRSGQAGDACRLDGLIWPKDGSASIAYAATAGLRLSSPGLRPFLARQESLSPAILRCASARSRVRRRSPSA
jgi:hypothetical protein